MSTQMKYMRSLSYTNTRTRTHLRTKFRDSMIESSSVSLCECWCGHVDVQKQNNNSNNHYHHYRRRQSHPIITAATTTTKTTTTLIHLGLCSFEVTPLQQHLHLATLPTSPLQKHLFLRNACFPWCILDGRGVRVKLCCGYSISSFPHPPNLSTASFSLLSFLPPSLFLPPSPSLSTLSTNCV